MTSPEADRTDWHLPRALVSSALLLPLIFLGAFFFYPLLNIFRLTLTSSAFFQLLASRYFLGTLWFTVWQAAASTLLTLLFGMPIAYVFARYEFKGKGLMRSLATLPFVMPTVVVAAAFRALLGPSGPVNQLLMGVLGLDKAPLRLEQTITIILLAHVFYNVAVVVRVVGAFWAHLDPGLSEAAQVLGASPRRAFWQVTLPVLRPPLISASLLIFLFTFTSFGVILILGGPGFSTLETEIYSQFVTFLRPDVAGALSLLQILFTFLLMSAYARWQRSTVTSLDFSPQRASLRSATSSAQRLFLYGVVIAILGFLVAPLLAMVWRTFVDREGSFTLAFYRALPELRRGSIIFVPPLTAVRNSLGYATLTVLTAGFFGTLTATLLAGGQGRRAWMDPLFMLPLGASAVTLGFGYVVSYSRFRTSPMLVLVAHSLVAFPFVVRSLLPVLQAIKPGLREAAAVLGASPARVWREVDLPIVSRAMLVAAVFAFTISMGEFGATSFIARPNSGYLTLPIAIQRYLGQPGALNFGQAMAMSTVLMLVCAAGFVLIERFRYADMGEF